MARDPGLDRRAHPAGMGKDWGQFMTADGLTYGIVLSGGASQGAYHVGVLKALLNGESPATHYHPLIPEVFTGTSAGSVNAAALLGEIEASSPKPADHLERLWLDRIARTGTSCGSGVYRFRGNPTRFV